MRLRDVGWITNGDGDRRMFYKGYEYVIPNDGINVMRHGYDFDEDGDYSPGYYTKGKDDDYISNYLSCETWRLNDRVESPYEYDEDERRWFYNNNVGIFHPHFMFWKLGEDTDNVLMLDDEELWNYVVEHEPSEDVYSTETNRELQLNAYEMKKLDEERIRRIEFLREMQTITAAHNYPWFCRVLDEDSTEGAVSEDDLNIAVGEFVKFIGEHREYGVCVGDGIYIITRKGD